MFFLCDVYKMESSNQNLLINFKEIFNHDLNYQPDVVDHSEFSWILDGWGPEISSLDPHSKERPVDSQLILRFENNFWLKSITPDV